jgi:uncharacterized membrane protein
MVPFKEKKSISNWIEMKTGEERVLVQVINKSFINHQYHLLVTIQKDQYKFNQNELRRNRLAVLAGFELIEQFD